MPSLFSSAKDIAKGVRLAADTAVWAGNAVSRHMKGSKSGVCLVCNNLQPYGHEDTFGRPSAAWNQLSDPQQAARKKELASVPTLVLEEIPTKKILESREVDPKTGLPKNNCKYCRLLCEIFDAYFIDEWMSWITEIKNGMPIQVGLMIREGAPLIVNCWNFTYDKWFQNPRVDLELYMDPMPPSPIPGAPTMGPTGSRAADVRSEECMRFMKESINECCKTHPRCATQTNGFVPSRLIFVGGGNDALRLCDALPSEGNIAWAALSHCWGGGKPLSLTKSTLHDLKERIDFSKLPATFQDAITVTQELGLVYVWIDSLCIVQDDKTDWEKEAALMGSVYSRAFIVISGASSPNPSTPYLRPREEDWLPKRFDFPIVPGVNIPITVRQRHLLAAPLDQGLLEPPFTSSWATLKKVGPLYARGWCFQESFLASRILNFAPGAIIYECRTHRKSEDQLPPYPFTTPGTLGEVTPLEQWHMIVKSYTSRQLMFTSEKLPAIAGAATIMPQAGRSRYLAGLWSESLLLDLLWQVMQGRAHLPLMTKEHEENAPTWSWASMNWGVTWNTIQDPQLLTTVVDAQTNVVGANPHGQVSRGTLTLRGRIKYCRLSADYHKNEHWVYYRKGDGGSYSRKQHFRTDGALESWAAPGQNDAFARRSRATTSGNAFEAAAAFFCLAKCHWMKSDHMGLILGISPKFPGCMERVGSISNVPKDWYDTGIDATVTIV
ncbi:HET-domain-containing protein [Daldinia caldariorum]|uniref:HET-domain-containing protein n=1 Tax=Daldinia caldariorum TaxID=326644 RepID=UPI0020084463|nr:HET-domain-containing protein [Daldinia caldariorum]KAI1466428.1 HET-domain-containing protein [Daldinia caldariorum]